MMLHTLQPRAFATPRAAAAITLIFAAMLLLDTRRHAIRAHADIAMLFSLMPMDISLRAAAS